MKTVEIMQIIYMVSVGILLIISLIHRYMQDSYCKELKKRLEKVYKLNDFYAIYCLTIALNEHVKKEQYEEANKIKYLIIKIKQND